MEKRPTEGPERRPEPEIIPPDRTRSGSSRGPSQVWISIGGREERHRIHVERPGFFTVVLVVLLVSVAVAALLALILGTFLIVVPAIFVLVLGVIAVSIVRAYFSRLRSRRSTDRDR